MRKTQMNIPIFANAVPRGGPGAEMLTLVNRLGAIQVTKAYAKRLSYFLFAQRLARSFVPSLREADGAHSALLLVVLT